ncbi:adenine nucleotide alpha hydrolases-like protein [Xylaria sp. CBS 124048]|nr:adenine nucleotide alpha hydrolases-like protein [Xylaria sp. CBS 124048]
MTQDASDPSFPTAGQANVAVNGYPTTTTATVASTRQPRSLHEIALEIQSKVDGFLAEAPEDPLLRTVQSRVREAIRVVDEAFRLYQPQQIALSYNGGKDCLVLLIIILACLARRYPPPDKDEQSKAPIEISDTNHAPEKLQAVYIVSPHSFSEIDDFVASSSATYQLDVKRYELSMKQGLQEYLTDRPAIKAIFVGTRRTDPHGKNLTHFNLTDGGWPAFMRIHPVIDWHYAEIWAFIRHLQIPYCPLYDQGYTSLGGTEDTQPNPHLQRQAEEGGGFLPAYELLGDEEERLGRDK